MKYRIERSPDGRLVFETWKRGHALLSDALLNKGTAFTHEERELFDLEGLLPYQVTDQSRQVRRAYESILRKGDDPLERYIGMAALQDRNETLFYQVLAGHLEQLVPVVYTPTVGRAATMYSHIFRRGRGLWITPEHKGRIYDVLGHARTEDVRLMVVTDNERILGLGDQGAGGMVIPVGKLVLYTAAAGIHPAYTLPVSLDFGTDNTDLLKDDLYVGWRHPRLRGDEYFELLDEFVDAVSRRFPGTLVQWEDFKKGNAFAVLDRYRDRLLSFNDDIEGTAAVVVAGLLAAAKATGIKLSNQRVMIVGAGAAGVGIARLVRHALADEGLADEELTRQVAVVDSAGLVRVDRQGLDAHKWDVAWRHIDGDSVASASSLTGLVDAFRPTVLIGTTGQPGLFPREVISAMAEHADRPVVMPLSNPDSKCEVRPADVVAWTHGRGLVATGSPFEPVAYRGRVVPVSQANNVFVFPGVGLGALAVGAHRVTEPMFLAAARTLAEQVERDDLDRGLLYPPIGQLRDLTRAVAIAAASAASADELSRLSTSVETAVDEARWDLDYPVLRPV